MLICGDGRVLTLGGLVGDKVRNLLNLPLLEGLGWGDGRFVSNLRDLARTLSLVLALDHVDAWHLSSLDDLASLALASQIDNLSALEGIDLAEREVRDVHVIIDGFNLDSLANCRQSRSYGSSSVEKHTHFVDVHERFYCGFEVFPP